MLDILSSIIAGMGSFFSGVLQIAAWVLALQGLLLGLMVLFYGRRSFWVLASVVGFVFGLWLASSFDAGFPAWAQALLALTLGIACAAVGFFAPRPIAAAGGSLMLALLGWAVVRSAVAAPWLEWLVALVLGFVGFYLFWRLLDWALIVVTSLSGAILASISLTSLFGFARGLGILPFLMFFVAGTLYQARDRRMAIALQQLRLQLSPPPADVPLPAPWPSAGQPAALPPPVANADATTDTPGDAAASLAISG